MKTVPRSPPIRGEHHGNPISPTHFYFDIPFHSSLSDFFCISPCSCEQQSIATQCDPHRNQNYSQKRPQSNETLGNGLTFRKRGHSDVPNLKSEIRLPLGFLSKLYRIGRKKRVNSEDKFFSHIVLIFNVTRFARKIKQLSKPRFKTSAAIKMLGYSSFPLG